MKIWVCRDKDDLGLRAASQGAFLLREALAAKGSATVVLAAGASQFETLAALAAEPDVDWEKVELFQLDEFVGLPADHPASRRRCLRQRLLDKLPTPPAAFHAVAGDAADPAAECARLNALLAGRAVDVLFCGVGRNGNLAFNGPPADVEAADAYRVVPLDDDSRQQQADEGWFPKRGKVPKQAISMSVRQTLSADAVVCAVPGEHLADAVVAALEGAVTPDVPASALQRHPNVAVFLDRESGKLLA